MRDKKVVAIIIIIALLAIVINIAFMIGTIYFAYRAYVNLESGDMLWFFIDGGIFLFMVTGIITGIISGMFGASNVRRNNE